MPGGGPAIIPGAKLYAIPSFLDIHVKSMTGSWQLWSKNPSITNAAFQSGIEIVTDPNSGIFDLFLPFTDTECYRKAGGTIKWQIWDPTSSFYYEGTLGYALWTAGPYSIKDLLSTMGSDWVAVNAARTIPGIPPGPLSTEFTASGGQTAFTLPVTPITVTVYRNGLRLRQGATLSVDFFSISGAVITLGSPCAGGEIVVADYV